MPPPLVLLVIAVIGAVAYLVIKNKGSGTPVCAPACVLPQTCVAGTCTTPAPACTTGCTLPAGCTGGTCVTPPVCTTGCTLPAGCTGGTCTTPPATCTAAQFAKMSAPASILSKCVGTTDGKWLQFDSSAIVGDRFPGYLNQLPLDQCKQKCSDDPLCTSFFYSGAQDCFGYGGPPNLIDYIDYGDDHIPVTAYVRST